MRSVSATEVKNRFGAVIDMALSEPVLVEKSGRAAVVILSAQEYEQLLARAPESRRTAASPPQRREPDRVLRAAKADLIARLRAQPATNIGRWSRDELHGRDA